MPIVKVSTPNQARKFDFLKVTSGGKVQSRTTKEAWEKSSGRLTATPVRAEGKKAFSSVKIRARKTKK